MPRKISKKQPLLLAVPTFPRGLQIWCPYCQQWHHHGRAEHDEVKPGEYYGHRVAHCTNTHSRFRNVTGSHPEPFFEAGYQLRFPYKKELKAFKDAIKYFGV